MIMADVLKIALIIIGFLLCYVVYWLASAALFPAVVERAKQQYDTRPVRATLAGLGLALPFIALSVGIGSVAHPAAKMLGVALIGIPILYGLLGSAGLALRIGAGLKSSLDDTQPWRRILRGSVVLSLTFLLPVIGWFMNQRSRLTGIATGDQGLFMTRAAFTKAGGFANIALMEDVAMCCALKKSGAPLCLPQKLHTSGRRWEKHGVWRTIFLMWRIRLAYFFGADPLELHRAYYGAK